MRHVNINKFSRKFDVKEKTVKHICHDLSSLLL
jgi:hypothetical protein